MNRLPWLFAAFLVAGLVVVAGCGEPDETPSNTSTGASQLLLGTPELSSCLPTVCDLEGMTREEVHAELKTFWQTQPACTEIPPDLSCRVKGAEQGDDWPETMESRIQSASEMSGGFLDEQIDALRCLGFMEPSGEFLVSAGAPDARLPSRVQVDLEVSGSAEGVSLHDDFLDHFGALVGTILHITDDYEFKQVRRAPGDDVELRFSAVSYKGIPVDPGVKLRVDVNLHNATWPSGPGESELCPGRWVFADFSTTLSRHIETLETNPANLLSGEEAVAAALAQCGDDCSHPVTVWDDVESGPDLFITAAHVVWRVMLDCPVPERTDELWMCTYRVDAETGVVLSGSPECCID